MSEPVISVAMATRNSARHISDALASIAGSLEGSTDYEVVIADGGSSDKTLDIARVHPNVRIVSERDGGIYDGMNKAITAARGGWLVILNSDDLLLRGGLSKALEVVRKVPGCEVISGGIMSGATLEDAVALSQERPLTPEGALFGIPAINARVYRASLMARLGPIRIDAGLAADREYVLRLCATDIKRFELPDTLYFYRCHEGSQTLAGDNAARLRVYRAEQTLAKILMSDHETSGEIRRLARAAYALADLKLSVKGGERPQLPLDVQSASPGFLDLARGFWWTRQWRGRLAGA